MKEFALRGIKPRDRLGESIHYDVWSWRPLWHLIVNNSSILGEDDRILGQSKGNTEIRGEKHSAVVDSLYRVLRDRSHGELHHALNQAPFLMMNGQKSIVDELNKGMPQNYHLDWNEIIDFLRFCKSNEGFAIG